MPIKKIDNITLIIIDQLRADYGKYFKKTSQLLPYSAIIDTNSIPTSTEAMHANISTGVHPSEHGFIFKYAKNGKDGLEELSEKMMEGALLPLSSLGEKYHYNNYIIGGKPETVHVMGFKDICEIIVQLYHKSKYVDGKNEGLVKKLDTLLEREEYKNIQPINADLKLLKLFNILIKNKKTDNSFFILTLPTLDYIGHEFGPNSEEVKNHISKLDEKISSIIYPLSNKEAFLIVGDHGCRKTSKYIIEIDEKNFRKANVYILEEGIYKFLENHYLGTEGNIKDIQYDGGIMRVWFNKGTKTLSEKDIYFLSNYGTIISSKSDLDKINGKIAEIYKKSKHPNLGDTVVVANEDATFCKYSWIKRNVINNISKHSDLFKGDLPIGEHGSFHNEDRKVYFMSNYNFEIKEASNVLIKNLIESLIQGIF